MPLLREERLAKTRVANAALTALNTLAGFKGHPGEFVNQVQQQVRARCLALASRWRPLPLRRKQPSQRCSEACRSMVPATHWFPSVLTKWRCHRIWTTRQRSRESSYLEGDQERVQLEHD